LDQSHAGTLPIAGLLFGQGGTAGHAAPLNDIYPIYMTGWPVLALYCVTARRAAYGRAPLYRHIPSSPCRQNRTSSQATARLFFWASQPHDHATGEAPVAQLNLVAPTRNLTDRPLGQPEVRLSFLTAVQVARIDALLAALGDYGEIHLIVQRGELRYINRVESYKAWEDGREE
jgi:hypothetical protein